MQKILCLLLINLSIAGIGYAQPDRSIYSEAQRRQARETQETNRHYEAIKPSSSSSGNSPISGDYNAYQMADYSNMKGIQEAEARQKKREAAFSEKERKLAQIIRDNGLGKHKLYYPLLLDAARMAGFDSYWAKRVFGDDAATFEDYVNHPTYYLHKYFPYSAPKPAPASPVSPPKDAIPATKTTEPDGDHKAINQASLATQTSTPGKEQALTEVNQFLVTLDNGYFGRIEVIQDELFVRYKSGQFNRVKISDLAGAEVDRSYKVVSLKCKGTSKCIYSSWFGGGQYEYVQFTSNVAFDLDRLCALLNNLLLEIKTS